jgi:hypothetical protein
MQHLEVSGAVRHIYIYIYNVRQLRVKKKSGKERTRKVDNHEGMNRPKYRSNTNCYDAKLLRKSMVTTSYYKLKIVVWSVASWSDIPIRYMWGITTYRV